MEGVIVLAEEAIYSYNYFLIIISGLFLTFGAVSALIGTITVICGLMYEDPLGLLGVFLFATAILLWNLGSTFESKIEGTQVLDYIEQKVIVEDTVNMNEFFDHYELLDRDGEIYIIREKPIE